MRNCNCSNSIRQDKDEIIKRAIKYAITFEVDVQVHSWTQRGFGRLWDYEEKGSVERGKGIVEIIKFRDHKGKDVLSNTEHNDTIGEVAGKPKGTTKRGSVKSGKKTKRAVSGSDEPVGGVEVGDSTESVE